MPDCDKNEVLLRQRKVLADFGDVALQSEDLDEVLQEACRLVGEALGTGGAKVLEIEPGGQSLFVRAGVGWAPEVVGQMRLTMAETSSESFSIALGEPVFSRDIGKEDRFEVPAFMEAAGVVALVNVPVFRPGRLAYGLLQVDDTVPRDFDQDDIEFLRIYAAMLGLVIDRLLKLQGLRTSEERLGAFVTATNDVVYRMSPDWSEMRELKGQGFLADMLRPSTAWEESYIHPDDQATVQAAIDQAIRTQSVFELEHRVRHAQGGLAWMLSRAVPIKDAQGRIIEWLGAARDVTARREAEARQLHELERQVRERTADLQNSRDFLQAILDSSLDMIQVFKAVRDQAGRIVDFRWLLNNHTSEQTYGKIEGESLLERNPGVIAEGIFDAFKRVTESGTPEQAEHHYVHEQFSGWFLQSVVKLDNGVATTTKDISDWKRADAALRESEERFRLMADAVPQIVWVTDAEGRVEFFNKQWSDYTGVPYEPTTAAEVAAHHVHPHDGAATIAAFDEARRTGSTFLVEHRIRGASGGYRWFLVRAEPYRDPETGGIVRWFGASVDIHDRRQAEAELRESEDRFRAIVETATDYAIFTTDAEGRIAVWPRGAQEIFGWSAEEAVGQRMEMTYTPEDRANGVPAKERETAREKGHAPNVRWHVRKDGSRVFIDGVARPLTGPDGTVTGFVKVGQDVTERRATEGALRESEARFQQFGEASSDVLWIRDCESLAYEYLSPAYEQVYGSLREEALRGNQVMRWMELIHPDDREKVLDLLRRVRAGEDATETYRVIRPSDGQTRWIRNTDFPLRDADGRVQRIGGLSHDVTDEVENRHRLEVLVNELQHRTRNLIAVVNSIARQTMAHTGPTEAFREEFGHRMAALSRVQGLLSRAQDEPITLRALLEMEIDALGARESERVRLDGPWVRIRPTIVQTVALVVHELATNSRKYGALSGGEGRLSVEWHLHEVEGERRVFIDWRETDLEPTDAGPSAAERGGGYGRRLIERALPQSLGAATTYALGETDLRCTIDLPLDRAAPAQ